MPFNTSKAARQARAEQRAEETATRENERAWGAYWASPEGQAEKAKEAGQRFFQIEIPHSSVRGFANAFSPSGTASNTKRHERAPDILGGIEAQGWRLVNSAWVYVQTGQNSRDKFLASGQQVVVTGEVVGIYLFRNTDFD
jgi:hypothetical protein